MVNLLLLEEILFVILGGKYSEFARYLLIPLSIKFNQK